MAEADDAMIPFPPEPMTIEQLNVSIEQLKTHVERRFDRLERTNADRSDLRRLAARVNRCATRADLKAVCQEGRFQRTGEEPPPSRGSRDRDASDAARNRQTPCLILGGREARIAGLERRS